jgi:hypothetical protein
MTVERTSNPKGPTSATHAQHGCCGGEAAIAVSRKEASKCVEHDHDAHAAPTKAAQSSCCCGGTKESRPSDPNSRVQVKTAKTADLSERSKA